MLNTNSPQGRRAATKGDNMNEMVVAVLKRIKSIADFNIDDSPDWLRVYDLSEVVLELVGAGGEEEG